MKIAGSVFVVTGAGSGLGAAVAERLAGLGASILIADINTQGGETIAARLGSTVAFVRTDVTDESEGRAAIDKAVERFGGVHGLVNCAGIAPGEKVLGRDGPHRLESFARAIAINLTGTFNMIRLAAEVMARNDADADGNRGVVVNTASVAAFDGQIGQAAYAASKGGVAAMTLPIARELARHGIRVATIAPGIFETPMMAGLPEEVQESLGKSVPYPSRLGRPDEYAAMVQHIVENDYLNGEVIRLDGALRMAPR